MMFSFSDAALRSCRIRCRTAAPAAPAATAMTADAADAVAAPPLILVDTSYFIFYRYYAVYNWYSLKNRGRTGQPRAAEAESHTELDPEFLETYQKTMFREIERVRQMWRAEKADIIFCLDCPRQCIWRNEIYAAAAAADTAYKGERETAAHFDPQIFPYTLQLLREAGYKLLGGDQLEADDVVYAVVRDQGRRGHGHRQIICITNDNDYLQLRSDNVLVFNLQDKNLATRSCGTPAIDLLRKILVGDKSDNIPPVYKGLGPKTAEKLAELDEDARREAIAKKGGDSALAQYELNRRLIDFQCIPETLLEKLNLDGI